jgi:hypothetical protein
MEAPKDLISSTEARLILQVSNSKMAQLLKDGAIRCYPNILDKRVKFVSKAEVLALKPTRAEAA